MYKYVIDANTFVKLKFTYHIKGSFQNGGNQKQCYLDLLLAMADSLVSATDLAPVWEKCADLRRRASQHQVVSRIQPIQVFLLMATRI